MSNSVIEGEKESSTTVEHTQALSKSLTLSTDDEAPVARGVDAEEIPSGYWLSFRFLGSTISIVLLAKTTRRTHVPSPDGTQAYIKGNVLSETLAKS
ncbi:hypothetical protein PV11_00340 [Exophiala sideris]|uniref:Uncharacterized protein n=1 Tax=Exophiala sideris TaxID=1016849 RepID=A0A0D1YP18_9EURO|nr:hypothetical protein PV11_00340 [Exophiala sideris]